MAKQIKKVDKRSKAYKYSIKEEDNFIIETNDDDIKIARLSMAIKETIPTYLLDEIMKLVDCECRIQAYDKFIDDNNFRISVKLQDAINKYYEEAFNERIRRTSCPACMRRRITKVRNHIKELING